ncbi:mucin-5AC-like isoform X2 [Photinus pyralis]|nr:mucin-5AC-like isoform X2 [Photinus pyralis]
MGPYAYKENQWVGYDDEGIVRKKAEFVVERKLGGIMFWSIDNDDFRGTCHGKPYPLIEAAKDSLMSASEYNKIKVEPIQSTKLKTRPRPRPNRKEEEKTTTTTERHRPIRKRLRSKPQSTTASPTTSSPTLTKYQTPEPPTTPDPGSDFKCEDEGFFPHPRDCKKYFWCLSSGPSELGIVAHQFTCPSGLFFNKAADSCDYTQNVRCVKPKSTTTTSTSTTTTSTPSTTRRLTTSRTTTTSTTTPQAEEYEYVYDDEDVNDKDSEEDPRVIKELIDLIKKAGGIEELEKQLDIHKNGSASTNPGSTTPSGFSKVLYERVLKNTAGKTERPKTTAQHSANSRGPQFEGPREGVLAKGRARPQYTAINRFRSTTARDESEEDVEAHKTELSTTSGRKSNLPEYMTIIRQRASTTLIPVVEKLESEEDETATERKKITPLVPEYVTLRRFRPTTEDIGVPTEETSTKADNINNYIDNAKNDEEKSEARIESSTRRYAITTEPSSPTTKVSDPVPSKAILKPRPFQKPDTIHTNRYHTPPRRTTTTTTAKVEEATTPDDYDDNDKTNQLPKRRGSTRFEYPEPQNDQRIYQDRKFRPDIALEISDLSSLTSVDFSKPLNVTGGRRRVPPRRGNPDGNAIDAISTTQSSIVLAPRFQNPTRSSTTTTVSLLTEPNSTQGYENQSTRTTSFFSRRTESSKNDVSQATPAFRLRSTTPVTVLNETAAVNRFSRKPFRRTTTTEPPVAVSTTTESRRRPTRKIIRRYRPTSTTQSPPSPSNEKPNVTERDNSISTTQQSPSPSNEILSTTERGSSISTTQKPPTPLNEIPSATERDNSIGDDDEEEENIKLSETTIKERSERINSLQNDRFEGKQIFSGLGKTSYQEKGEINNEDYSLMTNIVRLITEPSQSTTPPEARTRKIVRKLGLASTTLSDNYTPVVQEATTEAVTDEISTDEVRLTTVQEVEPATSKLPAKPFPHKSKFSRPPFLLQRTRASTEAPASSSTKRSGFRARYDRKRPTSLEPVVITPDVTTEIAKATREEAFRSRYERKRPSTTEEVTKSTTTEMTTSVEDDVRLTTTEVTTNSATMEISTQPELFGEDVVDGYSSHYEPTVETTSTTLEGSTYKSIWDEVDTVEDKTRSTPMEGTSTEGFASIFTTDDVSSTTTEPSTSRASSPSTTRKFRKRRPTKSRISLSRNIDSSHQTLNSADDVGKTYKSKLNLNRNVQEVTTTEPVATATLLHVFAEAETSSTTEARRTDKIEKLIEINRIVEVSLKEGKLKNRTVSENEVTLLPTMDRVGAINRVTNIKIVDSLNSPPLVESKSIVNTFTPRPHHDPESSTIALEGLFQFKNEQANDELLETEHARYVNVRVRPHDEYTTSKAEVVEITPKARGDLIRIAPIAISLKTLLERGIDNVALPNN